MEFVDYRALVQSIKVGKKLPDAVYIHESALSELPEALGAHVVQALGNFEIDDDSWNIIKFARKDFKLTFLNYPDFDHFSYPQLKVSQTIDFIKQTLRTADYTKSDNPPILHRKETFVPNSYPLKPLFVEITKEGEEIGLYDKTNRIGFKKNWERLIKSKGFYLDEAGRLKPLSVRPHAQDIDINFSGKVERHRTAINRNQLSQPMQALARHNYLNGDYNVLDYGCGKGDDVRELEAHGIDVIGWDPVHRLEETLAERDIVNLGFVLNVIEDRQERTQTLLNSWKLTNKILVVAVMVAGESTIRQFTPYKDGVITSINTFQKYYSQGEIKYYIESTLDETAIAVGQGIFLVFKDKLEEQLFLSERQHIRRDWSQKTQRQLELKPETLQKDIIDKNIELFSDYWETTLELGRIPANSEFEFSDQIRRICGSNIKAHQTLLKHFGSEVFDEARNKRKEDLFVYFALSLFEKRKPQSKMPESLRRDIKAFFPGYKQALVEARDILFSVGSPAVIHDACSKAYQVLSCGLLEDGHSFTFHRDYLGDLPAVLRIYIGCATQLYGDIDNFQLLKVHIRSGKVSLMRYDDWSKKHPLLLERIKIRLRDLDIDFYRHGDFHKPEPLTKKGIFHKSTAVI